SDATVDPMTQNKAYVLDIVLGCMATWGSVIGLDALGAADKYQLVAAMSGLVATSFMVGVISCLYEGRGKAGRTATAERPVGGLGSPGACSGDHLRDRGVGALQHLGRAAGARGAGGGARARAAGLADRQAGAESALAGRDADRAAGVATGDPRAPDGAADRGAAVPGQRAGATALARGGHIGGEARTAGVW